MSLNGGLNGLPAWVKIIAILGFPIFVAVYLLARDAGYVPSPLLEHTKGAGRHWEQTENIRGTVNQGLKIQRQICRNTAKTDSDRTECDR